MSKNGTNKSTDFSNLNAVTGPNKKENQHMKFATVIQNIERGSKNRIRFNTTVKKSLINESLALINKSKNDFNLKSKYKGVCKYPLFDQQGWKKQYPENDRKFSVNYGTVYNTIINI